MPFRYSPKGIQKVSKVYSGVFGVRKKPVTTGLLLLSTTLFVLFPATTRTEHSYIHVIYCIYSTICIYCIPVSGIICIYCIYSIICTYCIYLLWTICGHWPHSFTWYEYIIFLFFIQYAFYIFLFKFTFIN